MGIIKVSLKHHMSYNHLAMYTTYFHLVGFYKLVIPNKIAMWGGWTREFFLLVWP